MTGAVDWSAVASTEPHLHRVGERLSIGDGGRLFDRLRLAFLRRATVREDVTFEGRGLDPDLVAYAAALIGVMAEADATGHRPPSPAQMAAAAASVWGRLHRPQVLALMISAEGAQAAAELRRALCRPPTRRCSLRDGLTRGAPRPRPVVVHPVREGDEAPAVRAPSGA